MKLTELTPPHAEPESDPEIVVHGRTLLKHRIREIGRGRFGTVDLMEETHTKTMMAVKVRRILAGV